MKSSLPEAVRHVENVTERDDYSGEILPRIGTGHSGKPEQVVAAKRQL